MADTILPPSASSPPENDGNPVAELSRGVASVLPFLYVAWADGLLAPSEIETVRERLTAQDWITEPDRCQLAAWLDPADPPDATTYFGWVRTIRRAAHHLDLFGGAEGDGSSDGAPSLAGLGADLAALAGAGDGTGLTDESRRALEDLEALLGVVGDEAMRDLVEPRPPQPDDARIGPGVPGTPLPPSTPAFDVEALQAILDTPRAGLRERVRRLLSDPVFAYPDPEISKADYRDLVLEWTQHLADQGIGALSYPEYAGGQDSIGDFIAAFETIAYHDLSLVVKFGVQFGLWGGSVAQLGGEDQRKRYLPAIGRLDLPGGFAMSERLHGSNVRDLQTTATLDRETDEWVITTPTEADHKEWIGNAARHGQMMSVFAQLVIDGEGYGVHAFVVPVRDEDGTVLANVRIEDSGHKMGLNGVDNGRLWFDGVRVPRENLLDRFASVGADGVYTSPIPSAGKRFFVMLGTLVGGRIAVGSGANSAAKAGLAIAVRYGSRRRQFGPAGEAEVPLLDYLSHQRRLLPLVATSYGLTFALHELAEDFAALATGGDTREIEARAAALKALASWHCTAALQEAREACGGEGFRWTSRIAHRKADSDIFTTFEGDNTVLQLQVAKGLLAGYKQEFSDLNLFGALRYLREQADVRIGEINPLARRNTSEDHLMDAGWHADLFERRERMLLTTAAARLQSRIRGGMDSFDAFVEVQDHLLTLATAHGERLVLDAFQAAVERTDDGQLQTVLRLQCALYALTRVEAHRGWYLEKHLFDANVSKAIRRQVNALLTRIRPHAVELVDAFGIPPSVLGSDIA